MSSTDKKQGHLVVHKAHRKYIENSVGVPLHDAFIVEFENEYIFISELNIVNRNAEGLHEYIVTLPSGDSIVVVAESSDKAIQVGGAYGTRRRVERLVLSPYIKYVPVLFSDPGYHLYLYTVPYLAIFLEAVSVWVLVLGIDHYHPTAVVSVQVNRNLTRNGGGYPPAPPAYYIFHPSVFFN
jgi:hypothetical protein